ncbi:MAG: hypothetical protein WA160_09935 [Pseudobdellovibrio sp.]
MLTVGIAHSTLYSNSQHRGKRRYYGEPKPALDLLPYKNEDDLVKHTFLEARKVFKDTKIDGRNYFFSAESANLKIEHRKYFTPFYLEYWKRDNFDDHILKLAYSGLELLDQIPVDDKKICYNSETFWAPFIR